ncbi:hypothetical protein Hs30E_15010 [Lactococcus hodotermopsidis]|uniref:Uncharacterized protein n=1 Tax=Pseudolactococcus hodotermopsidis TaxID=2709157 RepID=A0A6A0BC22_9LACT|nr:hypothetical protein [Lactococcus hodotermopsidis]GFH42950.1 hypothetical protein Hs30E_15010 [Lactococcus hodotermopsidis]
MTVRTSNAIENFGLIGFFGTKVRRLAEKNLVADEVTEISAVINLAALPYEALGISSYNVPLRTRVDIVDMTINKI